MRKSRSLGWHRRSIGIGRGEATTVCFARLKDLAALRRRFGYRRLHLLLQRGDWQ